MGAMSGRRRLLRLGVCAATAAVALAAGCARPPTARRARSARPAAAAPSTTVTVALDVTAFQKDGTPQERAGFYREILQRFDDAHPGLRAQLVGFLNTDANMAAIIAGGAPDVFPDCCRYGDYVQAQLLLDLEPYLRRDNVNTAIWSPSQVGTFDTGFGVFALSRNVDAHAFAVRLDAFDSAGMPYPSPEWTYQDFARLAAALTRRRAGAGGAVVRYGAGFQSGLNDLLDVVPGFGGQVTNPARTRQTLATPAGIAAGEWLVAGLYWSGIAAPSTSIAGSGSPNLGNGQLVMQDFQVNWLLPWFTAWHGSFKWRFYPPPLYPHGRANPVSNDFWGVSATTRQPEAAWQLVKWLSAAETYQRFVMKTFLFTPALNSLWAEWEGIVEATVPGLKGTGLHYFVEAAQQGWGTPQLWFRYGSSQALTIDQAWWGKLLGRAVGLKTALAQADAQVNALIATEARTRPVPLAQRVAQAKTARRRLDRMFGIAAAP